MKSIEITLSDHQPERPVEWKGILIRGVNCHGSWQRFFVDNNHFKSYGMTGEAMQGHVEAGAVGPKWFDEQDMIETATVILTEIVTDYAVLMFGGRYSDPDAVRKYLTALGIKFKSVEDRDEEEG